MLKKACWFCLMQLFCRHGGKKEKRKGKKNSDCEKTSSVESRSSLSQSTAAPHSSSRKNFSPFRRNTGTRQSKAQRLKEVLKETDFSEEDIKKWYKKFTKENPSKQITVNEVKQILASRFPDGDPEGAAQRIMEIFDINQDGHLDFVELMMALSITRKGTQEEKLRLAFNLVDLDNSGTIELWEMEKLITSLHQLVGITVTRQSSIDDTPDSHASQLVKGFDQEKDGVITFEEFCEGVKKNPNLAVLITNFANPELICADFLR